VIGGGSLGNPGPSWRAIATGDFNGDGYADIVWQNNSGEVAIWR
jgi:serralysin